MFPIAGHIVGWAWRVSSILLNYKLFFRKLKSKIHNVINGLVWAKETALGT
jgi:hypothetical protein